MLKTLAAYRLMEPGSEWKLHHSWFDRSAMANLLDGDFHLAAKDTLYHCHEHLLEHREDLFTHLKERWSGLFGARYDILLYDLTSTYFEVDANGPVTEASTSSKPSATAATSGPQACRSSSRRLTKLEKDLAGKDWQEVKDDVHVKLLPHDGELYVLARSSPRRPKESAMRRKKLIAYWARLKELQKRANLSRDELLPTNFTVFRGK